GQLGPRQKQCPSAAVTLTTEQGAHGASDAPPIGEVVLAGAGPGDPDLLTMGARAILADADIVFHDALVAPEVLRLCGPALVLSMPALGPPVGNPGRHQRGDDRRGSRRRPG